MANLPFRCAYGYRNCTGDLQARLFFSVKVRREVSRRHGAGGCCRENRVSVPVSGKRAEKTLTLYQCRLRGAEKIRILYQRRGGMSRNSALCTMRRREIQGPVPVGERTVASRVMPLVQRRDILSSPSGNWYTRRLFSALSRRDAPQYDREFRRRFRRASCRWRARNAHVASA